jgi:hypothetical protein
MLDGLVVPRWEWSILSALGSDPAFALCLFVLNGEEVPRKPLPARVRHLSRRAAYVGYERVDARLFGRPDDAFAPHDLADEFAEVPRLAVVPSRPKPFEHRFGEADLEAIRAHRLDVLLRFGFAIIRGGILDVATHGVWSFHHDDNREYRGGPPFFWEMAEGNPVSGVTLQILSDELDGGRVIGRTIGATDPASLRRGRSAAYMKGVHLLLRRLRALHAHVPEALAALPEWNERVAYDKPIYKTPSNAVAARFAARAWGGVARRALERRRWTEDWTIGWRGRDGAGPPGLGGASGRSFTFLEPPPGHFWADPFLLERDGRTWLFLEDLDRSLGRASIAVAELREEGVSELRTVFAPGHHLSYPFAFEHDGEAYLVPESAAARTVELWRAVELPDRFERVATLMDDVEAYDATLLRRDGRWWMFVTIAMPGGPTVDELFVFSADSLTGPYEPHPSNPVVSDVRCARPAGRVFEHDGRLIRPAQDSSGRYGRAIVWREIDVLATDDYAERTVGRLDPDQLPGTLATHTYDATASFEVVDALVRRRR